VEAMQTLKNRLIRVAAQMKRHFCNSIELIIGVMNETVNYIIAGYKERDTMKVITFSTFLLSIIALLITVGLLIAKIIIECRRVLITVGLFIAAAYSIKYEEPRPTQNDYQKVLETIRPSVAAVALPLKLAPIDDHTNMEISPEKCIQPWKGGWRLVYKALKKSTDPIDRPLYLRTIQKAIEMTLNQDNPAGFSDTKFKLGAKSFPIIIVDEVADEETYIYIYAVIASRKYLRQKFDPESNTEPLSKANIDDEDF